LKLNVPKIDYDREAKETCEFIKKTVKHSKASGVVIGLSGGIDSSLTAALCVRALGKEAVLGVIMPAEFTPSQDGEDAEKLSYQLGISVEHVKIQDVAESLLRELHCDQGSSKQKIPAANIYARIRMVILYYYANLKNYLVAGTGDRSETLIGYFTKHGDGGADFFPIRHLYKTQVRDFARYLGVPEELVCKQSSPQLYPGHKVIDEIPVAYEELDPILVGLFEIKLSPREVSELTDAPIEVVEETLKRFIISAHKRAYPPMIRK
jgi:NAD+ synthase